jgi:hypothetical protein
LAQKISCYRVTFSMVNPAGAVTSGPYTTNIGIGPRQDDFDIDDADGEPPTPPVMASLSAALTYNLAEIMLAMGAGTGAPGGSVRIENFAHASSPDLWVSLQ